MAYSGQTPFYSLPYMRQGDYLTETEEKRRALIIDNLMYVATFGASKAVIEDGIYTLSTPSNNSCNLTISSAGSEYVLMAIVNYRLAYKSSSITLSLSQGKTYYIYVIAVDSMDVDPTLCSIEASEDEIEDVRHLLIATVDYTSSTPVLDTDTDKRYLTNMSAHTMDSTNPHGTTMYQKDLNILGTLNIHSNPVLSSVLYTIESSTGETPTSVTITGMTPKFVTAMVEETDVGIIACKINADKTISVTNSGATGKKIVLKVEGTYDS